MQNRMITPCRVVDRALDRKALARAARYWVRLRPVSSRACSIHSGARVMPMRSAMLEIPLMMTPLRPAMARKVIERPADAHDVEASAMSRSKAEAMRKMGMATSKAMPITTRAEASAWRSPSMRDKR